MNKKELPQWIRESDRKVAICKSSLKRIVLSNQARRRVFASHFFALSSVLILCGLLSFVIPTREHTESTNASIAVANFEPSTSSLVALKTETDTTQHELQGKLEELKETIARLNRERLQLKQILVKERISSSVLQMPNIDLIEF